MARRPAAIHLVRSRSLEDARALELAGKEKGRQNGPLGYVALELLGALWDQTEPSSHYEGHLAAAGVHGAPTAEQLRACLSRSKSAVEDALARLEVHGFIYRVVPAAKSLEGRGG